MTAQGFSRTPSGIRLELGQMERAVLADLVRQMSALLGPADEHEDPLSAALDFDRSEPRPDDPAMLRLFPDAYRDDPEEAASFRRYTQESVRQQKVANLVVVLRGLEENATELSDESAGAWLGALNDLRLALGTRLEVTEDESWRRRSRRSRDPEQMGPQLYDWLTWLQSSLIESISECL